MSHDNACHMMVFRAVRRAVTAAQPRQLRDDLRTLPSASGGQREELLLRALLRAGELECALEDAGSAQAVDFRRVTDALAMALLAPERATDAARAAGNWLSQICWPACANLEISPPEGFCYYALHPLDYVEMLPAIALPGAVAVIGIRSIGATLSAVVTAALEQSGRRAARITVRPGGHPYDRKTEFSNDHLRWMEGQRRCAAVFLVVDEGPGLSGSSLISVGEALLRAGISAKDILFLCSRSPDPEALVAPDAARRWNRFRSYVVNGNRHLPSASASAVPLTDWRPHVLGGASQKTGLNGDRDDWPAVWGTLAPPKFLSGDGATLFKFEGLGWHGYEARARSRRLADAGFGPDAHDAGHGFSAYAMLPGRALAPPDVSAPLLERIAAYLAFRASEFTLPSADVKALQEMASFNYAQLVGNGRTEPLELAVERPVVADARMMPYEWIRLRNGSVWKLDAAMHGDNHFYPGPADIAWDLAGAVVEWRLPRQAMRFLLERYQHLSGDKNCARRLQPYMLAYAAFQAGYSKMAAASLRGTGEDLRFERDAARYCQALARFGGALLGTSGKTHKVRDSARDQALNSPHDPKARKHAA